MKKMIIYEPAMCCSTGLCGVGIDPELLRISTVLASLEKNEIKVERYNLTNAPQEFIKNAEVNQLISKGVDVLPITVLDGKVVITKRYPTNDEFISMLNVPRSYLGEKPKTKVKVTPKNSGGCGCSGGKCC
ncbi:Arsenical resistance operon trans-acting repressor ArsD [bioreactor metagenome]|uniref:Arsenical resistance operon trans-acting repressor ArsD n=1 Tax=bioreactor metagenome TaxID=1076179 RepID=A0A645HCU8_9ZZZZ